MTGLGSNFVTLKVPATTTLEHTEVQTNDAYNWSTCVVASYV